MKDWDQIFPRRQVARTLIAVILLGLAVSGCKVGPDYKRPEALPDQKMPGAFSGESQPTGGGTNEGSWTAALPAAHLPRGAWWEIFGDEELNRLEGLVNERNQDLAAALARLDQARAAIGAARADLFPQVDVSGSYTRTRTSENQPVAGRAAGTSVTYNNFYIPLQAGWELDLWGRVRRQVETARARLQASEDDVESLKLALQAELANDYFALRAAAEEYAALEHSVEAYRRSLELTVNRRKGGIASDLDVSQAQTQLAGAEAQLPGVKLQQQKLLHAIASLCGEPATGFAVGPSAPVTAVPPVPVYVPSELLQRRPDIAVSERIMAAQNAQVGVAQSAFYPRVRLNGLAGLQSIDAGTLFNWPSRVWAVGPSLELPLFTGGRNRAQLQQARSAYNETVARYRQSVLNAFQEVEDALAARSLVASQLQAETAALESARRTVEIATNRYKAGLVTYLEVATAQTSALVRERAVAQLRGQNLAASVALVRALGGGWQTAP